MKIQNVKFPATPDATVEKLNELRPLIDKFYSETVQGNSTAIPSEMLAIMWHSNMVDFVELLDGDKRVGLVMLTLHDNEFIHKRVATIAVAYVEPEYRQQGNFKNMLKHIQVVFQARRVDYLEMHVPKTGVQLSFGEEVAKVYRMEL